MKNLMESPTPLTLRIEDILLDFASLYDDVSTSDLQGIAMIKAREIIKLVKEGFNHAKE